MAEPFNASSYLVDTNVERGQGDDTALYCRGAKLSYAELLANISDAARGLKELGVRPEERVLLVMADEPEFLAAFLGAMRIGAIPVPVNTMLTAEELIHIARDSRARWAIASASFAPEAIKMASGSSEVEAILLTGHVDILALAGRESASPARAGLHIHQWNSFMDGTGDFFPPHATWDESPGFWLYTSGTTGRPYAAMHRHIDLKVTVDTYMRTVLAISSYDRCFSVAKLFFAYGLGNSMTFPLAGGASTVLDPAAPTPASTAAIVSEYRPSLFFGVPTFYAALLASDIAQDTFRSVRFGVSAGEPLPASIFHRFRDRFGVEILDGIGSTEALHIFISNKPGDIRPGTTGTAVDGYELRLLDDGGSPCKPGEPGNLELRGDSIATGYWCNAASSRYSFKGEWLHTGDMYSCSDDGYYTYLSRSNDMIKAGGIWVSPSEVEATLIEHPDVLEVGVVGFPDEEGLDKPVACIVPMPGHSISEEEIIAFARQKLAPFKRPRRIIVLDTLPKTATGKIQRYKLRQALAAGE
ncbi:MAG: benzoate-CoA ligase family protein [Actinobacteria bacterium]|nr:benzoate-CoA ligase family protein [Actinomycetota bacterium]MCL5447275.1 benzoate-CoA ligase family protein [Actinomycetota bacterium]